MVSLLTYNFNCNTVVVMKVYRVKSGDVIHYIDLTYDSPSLRRAIRCYFGLSCDFKVVNILNVRQYLIESFYYLSSSQLVFELRGTRAKPA